MSLGEALTVADVLGAVRTADDKTVNHLLGQAAWALLGRVAQGGEGWAFRTGERSSPMPPSRDGGGFYPDTQVWPLLPKVSRTGARVTPPVLLGRSRSNDVIINHASISKLHARLVLGANTVTVEDAGSRNGTAANGRTITDSTPVHLKSGEILTVGSVMLVLFSTDAMLAALRRKAALER
jgi:hypothetical protein